MQIPFFNPAPVNAALESELSAAFREVLQKGQFILGERLQQFEAEYATWSGVQHCAGVGSGLDALYISLKVLGIGAGDEVIVPSHTFIATWLAVAYTGAKPVPVEPLLTTFNIDTSKIAAAITSRTKAIIPVHLYGQCCDMDAVMALARKHNLYVVEDNAQSPGATWNGKKAGSFGHLSATSFYPAKNLGALGDGGAIISNDTALIEKVKLFRNYGSAQKYRHDTQGINSRLDELQAALLSVKLPYLTQWNAERQQLAQQYHNALRKVEGITLPTIAPESNPVSHLYVIRTKQRDELAAQLKAQGIGTVIHYPVPPHLQSAFKELGYQKGAFPIAEEIADTCLSLPLYPGLKAEEVEYICLNLERKEK
jgi:dTDP-4-amino-4,6-dideoxygalactose transaminase